MSYSKQYVRHSSISSEEKLSKRLGLYWNKNEQDWEIVVSDFQRIEEFLKLYKNELSDDNEKFTLMGLIVSSLDDGISEYPN
ncbi:hypothetical protein ABN763_04730 [Spongiivirga sp. MCCC 1A20706]|uniref:hypothetical protein n=1 Tax=Spongiivirga sp. MCCC 1A20706 TaxID=3160963 RepID=UPI0039775594